jgi:demethylmenaquinone methyltransferase/2-methoxy-6-polyprenyl-1,4-benzoquinol methylase
MSISKFARIDDQRAARFQRIWDADLPQVFAAVANYHDSAINVASIGLDSWLREQFISFVALKPCQLVLDLCAGTNIIGIDILKRQPDCHVIAIDGCQAMQDAGQKLAMKRGFKIESIVHDVHDLPFPDDHFDIVVMRYASRHLRIFEVCCEVNRVLKPDGHFYHNDIFRLESKVLSGLYYAWLRSTLTFTGKLFQSGTAAMDCRDYFIQALDTFYTVDEFTELLGEAGFATVSSKAVLSGTVGFHKAGKPAK